MNFHKTIGFLASLLLMVGIGVPDSFAQPEITISVPANQRSILETGATLPTTVSVVVAISGVTEETIQGTTVTATLVGDPATENGLTPTGTVDIVLNDAGNSTGNAAARTISWEITSVTPDADADDDEIELTVSATLATGANAVVTSNAVTFTITDTQVDLTDNAEDASGFRLTTAAPAPGKWAKVGANQVKVQVASPGGPGQ